MINRIQRFYHLSSLTKATFEDHMLGICNDTWIRYDLVAVGRLRHPRPSLRKDERTLKQ